MNRRTLPRRARAHAPGWSHPYVVDPWAPLLYADGGDEDESEEPPEDDQDEGDDSDDADPDPEGADQLGDKGKRALATMKGKWRAERDKRRAAEEKLNQQAGQDDAERARAAAESAALAKANARILRAEVRAAAKGKLADPKDALTFLDLDQFEVGDDGEIDADEIEEAIDELIKNKPYLAAQGRPRFQGTGDGGAARKASRPRQLTKSDLKSMTAEEIDAAREAGKLDDLMGGI
ncbi:hypothetical protein RM844_28735 [Streptomyces sp. DSM 44915]|uniref:Scaffolding protein n=1 Tax=Streptomyces chisholmiae TaxID=3075540 RepID=A0ABU2JZT6_9ACTN|nr:hypothetical protein [Streptomyces sp. DSM 44915]MDT0270264.1 hypothetical protein [Streptomyces sp. DSM 44915]